MHWIAILAGGGGTRLWPLSRRKRPKQFLPLLPGDETLIGATARRVTVIDPPLVPVERVLVVTAASQVGEVRRCLPALPPANVVVEPEGRNTAPCIGLAAVEVLRRDPEAVLGVLPSDQHVGDEPRFADALRRAFAAAERGAVVTVGIRPTAPETGFGYIQAARVALDEGDARPVARFVEKPDLETARAYLASGDYLWNAGMFFFPARLLLEAIREHLPDLARVLAAIAEDPARTAALYPTAPRISIDYGVIEKLPGTRTSLAVVAGDFAWSDVGSFAALADVRDKEASGNVAIGDALAIDAKNNVLYAADGRTVAVVGVEGLVVVATDDAVLVLPRERAQDVRAVVEALQRAGRDDKL